MSRLNPQKTGFSCISRAFLVFPIFLSIPRRIPIPILTGLLGELWHLPNIPNVIVCQEFRVQEKICGAGWTPKMFPGGRKLMAIFLNDHTLQIFANFLSTPQKFHFSLTFPSIFHFSNHPHQSQAQCLLGLEGGLGAPCTIFTWLRGEGWTSRPHPPSPHPKPMCGCQFQILDL